MEENSLIEKRNREEIPWVTVGLIAANVLWFLYGMLTGAFDRHAGSADVLRLGAFYRPAVTEKGEWYRLITAAFVHFSPEHLGSNMLALFVLGSWIERVYGRIRFLCIYLFSGLSGSLLVFLLEGLSGRYPLSAGASGCIAGLLGAFIILTLWSRQMRIPVRRLLFAVFLLIVPGFLDSSVSTAGHLGGLLGGGVISLVFMFCRRKGGASKLY